MTCDLRFNRAALFALLVLFCVWTPAFAPHQAGNGDRIASVPPGSSRRIGVIGLKPGLDSGILGEGTMPFHPQVKGDLERLMDEGFVLRPMFSRPLSELKADRAAVASIAPDAEPPDLGRWLLFATPGGTAMEEALARLRALPFVETAYALPKASPAALNNSRVPNFTLMQGYIGPAPGGMDAEYIWTLPGGRGQGVKIADVEGDWNFEHNDLRRAKGKNVDGRLMGGIWLQHGTAVLGELVGTRNGFGVTGIAHRARVKMFSIGRSDPERGDYTNVPDAINLAAAALQPGDVILIEVQYEGLKQSGAYIPVEYYDADFEAIRAAGAKGIVVVEAAGNGSQNLDKSLYADRFNRKVRGDSRAIMVGAGTPPGGSRTDRSRLYFSNYGSRVDVQGWGANVTTTGYGGLYSNGGRNNFYTDSFNGTSSASAMVGAAAAVLQGYAKKTLGKPLKPGKLRRIFVRTGSPQQGNASNSIGPRPNLRKASKKVTKMAGAGGGRETATQEKWRRSQAKKSRWGSGKRRIVP